MNIVIFKPCKKIYFYENEEDHASWSTEIVNIAKLLAQHGHRIYIASPTDYKNFDIEGIHAGIPKNVRIDKVFIFNGAWKDKQEEINVVMKFRLDTLDINFILTDMRLMTGQPHLYRHTFTQSKRLYDYGAIQEHVLINVKDCYDNKTIQYYFGGTERGRTKDFMEYIVQPGCTWVGKSETLGLVSYVPHDKHVENLKKAKTTIIIADEEYNKNGFVNDRYYECAFYDVICFADSKFDPDELIMRKDDWRRVSSYEELKAKQVLLEKDANAYGLVLKTQRLGLVGHSYGRNLYNAIMI